MVGQNGARSTAALCCRAAAARRRKKKAKRRVRHEDRSRLSRGPFRVRSAGRRRGPRRDGDAGPALRPDRLIQRLGDPNGCSVDEHRGQPGGPPCPRRRQSPSSVLQFDEAGNPVDFTSTSSPKLPISTDGEIAVDNSGGPTQGNFYILHQGQSVEGFAPSGAKLGGGWPVPPTTKPASSTRSRSTPTGTSGSATSGAPTTRWR